MNTISLADLDQDTSSEGNSLLSVTQQLAVSLGISLSAMVLMLFQNSQIAESGDKIGVFRYTFLVMGLITILSSLVFTNLSKDAGSSMSGARSYKKE
ncbi:hypothetical protein BK387_29270 [Escherichia coli]|nr:hypothetical protein BK387_29270 [Escherichia coli]